MVLPVSPRGLPHKMPGKAPTVYMPHSKGSGGTLAGYPGSAGRRGSKSPPSRGRASSKSPPPPLRGGYGYTSVPRSPRSHRVGGSKSPPRGNPVRLHGIGTGSKSPPSPGRGRASTASAPWAKSAPGSGGHSRTLSPRSSWGGGAPGVPGQSYAPASKGPPQRVPSKQPVSARGGGDAPMPLPLPSHGRKKSVVFVQSEAAAPPPSASPPRQVHPRPWKTSAHGYAPPGTLKRTRLVKSPRSPPGSHIQREPVVPIASNHRSPSRSSDFRTIPEASPRREPGAAWGDRTAAAAAIDAMQEEGEEVALDTHDDGSNGRFHARDAHAAQPPAEEVGLAVRARRGGYDEDARERVRERDAAGERGSAVQPQYPAPAPMPPPGTAHQDRDGTLHGTRNISPLRQQVGQSAHARGRRGGYEAPGYPTPPSSDRARGGRGRSGSPVEGEYIEPQQYPHPHPHHHRPHALEGHGSRAVGAYAVHRAPPGGSARSRSPVGVAGRGAYRGPADPSHRDLSLDTAGSSSYADGDVAEVRAARARLLAEIRQIQAEIGRTEGKEGLERLRARLARLKQELRAIVQTAERRQEGSPVSSRRAQHPTQPQPPHQVRGAASGLVAGGPRPAEWWDAPPQPPRALSTLPSHDSAGRSGLELAGHGGDLHDRSMDVLVTRQQQQLQNLQHTYEERARELTLMHQEQRLHQMDQIQREREQMVKYEQAMAKADAARLQLAMATRELSDMEHSWGSSTMMQPAPVMLPHGGGPGVHAHASAVLPGRHPGMLYRP